MLNLPNNRWQAFSIHLAISAIIFVAILSIIYFIWYPGIFIQAGGWDGIKIIAAVDLVLGPALTLIVYNKAKKSIKFDLSAIAFLQISCLIAGLVVIERERPILQLLVDDSVVLHSKSDLEFLNIDMAMVKELPDNFPKPVYVKLANTREESVAIIVNSLFTKGAPVQHRFELFKPLSVATKEQIDWRLRELKIDHENNCTWMTISSAHFKGTACFHRQHGITDLKTTNND